MRNSDGTVTITLPKHLVDSIDKFNKNPPPIGSIAALNHVAYVGEQIDRIVAGCCDKPLEKLLESPVKLTDKPYRNQIRCVGITSWANKDLLGCGNDNRYSVGPIPKVADVDKSPRCPNCGGLVIEIGGPL